MSGNQDKVCAKRADALVGESIYDKLGLIAKLFLQMLRQWLTVLPWHVAQDKRSL